jgi:hypothetical protein
MKNAQFTHKENLTIEAFQSLAADIAEAYKSQN